MTAVVVTHSVGNIDTWLKGGADRKALFAKYLFEPSNFYTPLMSRTAFQSFARMWILLN
jgi:hypothetical protein